MIRFKDVNCIYPALGEGREDLKALENMNLHIEKGSFVAIVGKNGSGKSTAAKCVNALLLPNSGNIYVANMDTKDEKFLWNIRSIAGMVFQNPENQIISSIVEEDIAFGPENMGVSPKEIRRRIDEAMKNSGIYELRERSPFQLSGGQKQRVAIAGVLAMEPKCIIFDEATSMLDPEGRNDILDIMCKLHSEGKTIINITHFMEEAIKADRLVVMNNGSVIMDGSPDEIFANPEIVEKVGLKLPVGVRIREKLRKKGINLPTDILEIDQLVRCLGEMAKKSINNKNAKMLHSNKEGIKKEDANNPNCKENTAELADCKESHKCNQKSMENAAELVNHEESSKYNQQISEDNVIKVEKLSHIYNLGQPDEVKALDDISLAIPRGKIAAFIGHTGSGKSTLMQHLNGLIEPTEGRILIDGIDMIKEKKYIELRRKVGLVFQYPEYQLFEETVEKDIAFGPTNLGLTEEKISCRVKEAASLVGIDLEQIGSRSPFELSGGQKRKVAIAGVLAMEPDIFVLDEPAAGLDPEAHDEMIALLRNVNKKTGCTIVIVSHDMDDVAELCNIVYVMNKGKIAMNGTPAEVFRQGERLKAMGLELPAFVKFQEELEKLGIGIDKNSIAVERNIKEKTITIDKNSKENSIAVDGINEEHNIEINGISTLIDKITIEEDALVETIAKLF